MRFLLWRKVFHDFLVICQKADWQLLPVLPIKMFWAWQKKTMTFQTTSEWKMSWSGYRWPWYIHSFWPRQWRGAYDSQSSSWVWDSSGQRASAGTKTEAEPKAMKRLSGKTRQLLWLIVDAKCDPKKPRTGDKSNFLRVTRGKKGAWKLEDVDKLVFLAKKNFWNEYTIGLLLSAADFQKTQFIDHIYSTCVGY